MAEETKRQKSLEGKKKIRMQKRAQIKRDRILLEAAERKRVDECLHSAQVVVATGKYVGEGFDLPRLDTLFLAIPIAWKGFLAQYAGRIHRESEGKTQVTIHDYVDCGLPMLQRMFNKREKSYKTMGYTVQFSNEQRSTDTTIIDSALFS